MSGFNTWHFEQDEPEQNAPPNINSVNSINGNVQSVNRLVSRLINTNNFPLAISGQAPRRPNHATVSGTTAASAAAAAVIGAGAGAGAGVAVANGNNTNSPLNIEASNGHVSTDTIAQRGREHIPSPSSPGMQSMPVIYGHAGRNSRINTSSPYPMVRSHTRPSSFSVGYTRGRGYHVHNSTHNANQIAIHYRNLTLRPNPVCALNGARYGRHQALAMPNGMRRGPDSNVDFNIDARPLDANASNHGPGLGLGLGIGLGLGHAHGHGLRSRERGDSIQRSYNMQIMMSNLGAQRELQLHRPIHPTYGRFGGNNAFQNLETLPEDEQRERNDRNNDPRHRLSIENVTTSSRPVLPLGFNSTNGSGNGGNTRKFRSKFTKQNDQTPDEATKYAAILLHGIDGLDHFTKRFTRQLPR